MVMLETIFILLVMLLLAVSMRVVAEQQRIALFRLGRYAGLKGPGLVMVVPYMDRGCKIAIGDQGELMAGGTGKFREFQVPVMFNDSIPAGSSIRVVGFTKERLQVLKQ
ncbi:MAG: hypothetical protein K4571_10035 [Deltaproteobacteria bacterium]